MRHIESRTLRFFVFVAIGLTIISAFVAIALSFVLWAGDQRRTAERARTRDEDQRYLIHQICVGMQNQNKLIYQTLQRSKKNIPKLAYYQQHPREKREQINEINRSLNTFRPRACK